MASGSDIWCLGACPIGAGTPRGRLEIILAAKSLALGYRAQLFGPQRILLQHAKAIIIMGLVAETKRAMKNSPREIFNAYVFFCTWCFALSGVAKGFDEGESAK